MNKEKTVKTIFIFLFIVFVTIYISQATGYYEYELHKKTELTNEQISKFEADIKSNKKIDLEEYSMYGIKDYSNSFSKAGVSFSSFASKYIIKGIEGMIDIIEDLFT